MNQKEKVAIKTYAVRHGISIFNVVKMVRSGVLESESVMENGKEVTYILLDKEKEKEVAKKITERPETNSDTAMRQEIERLKREVRALRAEIESVKKDCLAKKGRV